MDQEKSWKNFVSRKNLSLIFSKVAQTVEHLVHNAALILEDGHSGYVPECFSLIKKVLESSHGHVKLKKVSAIRIEPINKIDFHDNTITKEKNNVKEINRMQLIANS